jgi:hypothetical protein
VHRNEEIYDPDGEQIAFAIPSISPIPSPQQNFFQTIPPSLGVRTGKFPPALISRVCGGNET